MLRALILTLILFTINPLVHANSGEYYQFIDNIKSDARHTIINNAKNEIITFYSENSNSSENYLENLGRDLQNQKANLYIFVSTSIPMSTLKNYYKEASKFGGVLVFKGLPNGSFKELIRVITALQYNVESVQLNQKSKQLAGAIIDDESFTKFNVESVPTIVLVKEEECLTEMSCNTTYDKISGNIGIRGAIQEFEKTGDLKAEAHEILSKEMVKW